MTHCLCELKRMKKRCYPILTAVTDIWQHYESTWLSFLRIMMIAEEKAEV